jgi:hypothetical protein
MPIDGALKAQLSGWYGSLDDTTKGVMEEFWRRNVATTADVISSGAWIPDDQDEGPTLADALGAPAFATTSTGLRFSNIEFTPDPPLAGGNVIVSASVAAPDAGQVGFSGTVTWTGPVNGTAALSGGPMEPNGSQALPFTIENAPAGAYNLVYEINPDGAPEGSLPNANGTQLNFTYSIDVLGEEGAADQQVKAALNYGITALTGLINPDSFADVKESVLEGLNWLAGASDPALAAAVGSVYAPLSALEPAGAVGGVAEAMTALAVAAQQVDWPFDGLPDVSGVTAAIGNLTAALAAGAGAEEEAGEGETEEQ